MLIELTYACSMNCSHCMSDCKPDGQHMSKEVLNDVFDFYRKNVLMSIFGHPLIFSGGEMFEHPDILALLDMIDHELERIAVIPVIFITNGRELVRNKENYKKVEYLQKKYGKKRIMIQVTDDKRFYKDRLTEKEKYWLKKLDAIIDTVPSDKNDRSKCLYPQGRALKNYSEENWNTKAPKCVNTRLLVKQGIDNIHDMVETITAHGKMCTPTIAPDGSIKLGESALCPSVATIYDSDEEIIEKIKVFNCSACKIPWERLKEANPIAYKMLVHL